MKNIFLTASVVALVSFGTGSFAQSGEADYPLKVIGYETVGTKPVRLGVDTDNQFDILGSLKPGTEVTLRVSVQNESATDISGLNATITSSYDDLEMVDGEVEFGEMKAFSGGTSTDTIT